MISGSAQVVQNRLPTEASSVESQGNVCSLRHRVSVVAWLPTQTRTHMGTPMQGLFVTGTDTGVGKTWVTTLLIRQLHREGVRVGAYKAVCTGAEQDTAGEPHWGDVEALSDALEGRFPAERICPQRFLAPLAPPVSARCEGRAVNAALLTDGLAWWRNHVDLLLVEGIGGLLCPLTDQQTVADFAAQCDFPLLIVAAQRLGMINHTLLTVGVARQRELPIAGIVVNQPLPTVDASHDTTRSFHTSLTRKRGITEAAVADPLLAHRASVGDFEAASNIEQVAAHCDAPILGTVPFGEGERLRPLNPADTIDWRRLSQAAT